jgi:hypothetical protein
MYSGSSSYKHVDRIIKGRSKLLMVCTPYIDRHYIDMLIKESRRKRVLLISSKASEEKLKRLKMTGVNRDAAFFSVLYSLFLIVVYPRWTLFPILFLAPLLISLVILILSVRGNMRVKIIKDRFVHEKLYISDGIGATGSANLTFAGMHMNVEHIDIVSDRDKLSALRAHFMELWRSD